MIFILEESVMNGTVTMQTMITGVEAPTFELAKARVQTICQSKNITLVDVTENDDLFSYAIEGEFPIYGRMQNQELKILS